MIFQNNKLSLSYVAKSIAPTIKHGNAPCEDATQASIHYQTPAFGKSFFGPHPNIYHFSNALLLYQTNAYIQLQNIRSRKLVKQQEETRRDFIRRTWASYTTGQISRKDYVCKMCYKFLPVL